MSRALQITLGNISISAPEPYVPDPDLLLDLETIVEKSTRKRRIVSAVYFLLYRGKVVYVGQSMNVDRRIEDHKLDPSKKFDRHTIIPCSPERLLATERSYIAKFRPIHNGRGSGTV